MYHTVCTDVSNFMNKIMWLEKDLIKEGIHYKVMKEILNAKNTQC